MFNKTKTTYYSLGAAVTMGMLVPGSAEANNFGNIAENVTGSIANVPGLLSALAYMFGILLGVLGILKIKDHVENPTQTPLREGAIRLAAGGALFALPIVYEAMLNTVNADGVVDTTSSTLQAVSFGVEDAGE